MLIRRARDHCSSRLAGSRPWLFHFVSTKRRSRMHLGTFPLLTAALGDRYRATRYRARMQELRFHYAFMHVYRAARLFARCAGKFDPSSDEPSNN